MGENDEIRPREREEREGGGSIERGNKTSRQRAEALSLEGIGMPRTTWCHKKDKL